MSRTIEKTVCKFEALDDQAKERARDWYRNGALDYDWWDAIYSDAVTIGSLLGITIDQNRNRTEIYFDGFYCQGQGSSFNGTYRYQPKAPKRVKDYAPLDEELYRIATALQAVQRRYFYRLAADIESHRTADILVSVYDSENSYRDIGDAEGEVTALIRDFNHWIFTQLTREYEWLTSDEVVDEGIIANEYEFYEDGSVA